MEPAARWTWLHRGSKIKHTEHGTRDCQNKTGNRQSKTLGLNKWTGKWQWETRHGSNYGTRTEDTTGWETWRWTQGEHGNKAGKQDTWTHTHTRRYTETASVTGLTGPQTHHLQSDQEDNPILTPPSQPINQPTCLSRACRHRECGPHSCLHFTLQTWLWNSRCI